MDNKQQTVDNHYLLVEFRELFHCMFAGRTCGSSYKNGHDGKRAGDLLDEEICRSTQTG
jgi:hypothetical protein